MNTTDIPAGDHITNFQQRLDASTQRGVMGPVLDADEEAASVANVDTADMVRQVEDRVASLTKRLNEANGFDEKTGAKRYVLADGDQRRKVLETELYNLKTSVLPYTRDRAATIADIQSRLPSPAQKLQAEANRQQRLAVAAQARAEEMEVEEMAHRLRSARKHVGSA